MSRLKERPAWAVAVGNDDEAFLAIPALARGHAQAVLGKALAKYKAGEDRVDWTLGTTSGAFVDLKNNPHRERVRMCVDDLAMVIAEAFSAGAHLGRQLSVELFESLETSPDGEAELEVQAEEGEAP